MSELNILKQKLLKKIKKYPQGISNHKIIKPNDKQSGIEYALKELEDEEYLSRLISTDDKITQAFGIEINKFTGDWILTEKGKAYLKNNKIEHSTKIVNTLIGFVSGIVATILAESVLYFMITK